MDSVALRRLQWASTRLQHLAQVGGRQRRAEGGALDPEQARLQLVQE